MDNKQIQINCKITIINQKKLEKFQSFTQLRQKMNKILQIAIDLKRKIIIIIKIIKKIRQKY